MPPGAVKLGTPSALLPLPIMGKVGTTSFIDVSAFWRVPMSMAAALAWFKGHPPKGLEQAGSMSDIAHGVTVSSGYGYSALSRPAWTGAEVEIGLASTGENTAVVRADGVDLWIDPVPVRDNQPGARMHLTFASGCPSTDQKAVGVTNPPPPLETSLLPEGSPTAGLVCDYVPMIGHPYGLAQSRTLDAAEARAFSVKIRQLPLGHTDGQVLACPNDEGSVTVVALTYPDGGTIDLWMKSQGCTRVSNGYISASGSVAV